MIELLLPSGIIGSLFFIFWLVAFPEIVYETMIFKDGDVEATKVGALSKSQLTAFIDSSL